MFISNMSNFYRDKILSTLVRTVLYNIQCTYISNILYIVSNVKAPSFLLIIDHLLTVDTEDCFLAASCLCLSVHVRHGQGYAKGGVKR